MRGNYLKPTQATGSAGDEVWRRRLLGRLNDIDNQEFTEGLGLQTDFRGQAPSLTPQNAAVALTSFAHQMPAHGMPASAPTSNALLLATITGQHPDKRPLDQVSGEVVEAWQDVDARREKLVLARHSAMHLAQRSQMSLFTAGITGLLGISTAVGFGVLQIMAQGDGDVGIVARVMPHRVSLGEKLGMNWAEGFANSARPVAEAALAAHNAMPRAALANVVPRKPAAVAPSDGQLGLTTRGKDQNVLPEPSKLSFQVALDGAGERTALLPLRLSDASPEDSENTIVVRNMPQQASLSAGVRLKSGEWALQLAELADLQIFLPAGTAPLVDLDLRVVRPRGEVVARTQIVLTTDGVPAATVAAASITRPATQATLGHAALVAPQLRDPARDLAAEVIAKARRIDTTKAIAATVSKLKTEAHAALPNAKEVRAVAGKPAAKKVDDYNALGADFARQRAEQAEAKVEAPKTWLGTPLRKMPDWMPASSSNQ